MLTIAVVVAPSLEGGSEAVWEQFVDSMRELRSQLPEQPPYRFIDSDPSSATGLLVERIRREGRETIAVGDDDPELRPERNRWQRLYAAVEQSDGLVVLWEGVSPLALEALDAARRAGLPHVERTITDSPALDAPDPPRRTPLGKRRRARPMRPEPPDG